MSPGPTPGAGPDYNWIAVDNQLGQFLPQVRHVLLRLDGPTPPGVGNPPVSPAIWLPFTSFALALAAHVSDTWRDQGLETIAYEIWNEPNLDYEWGGTPNAAQYTALLKAGYLGIKAGDPAGHRRQRRAGDDGRLARGRPNWPGPGAAQRFYGATRSCPT